MKDDGYTLAEALAALFMIGLAIGGLIEGVHVMARLQGAATVAVRDSRDLRAAGQGLSRLLAQSGPYLSDGKSLTGDGSEMTFPCGVGAQCAARLAGAGTLELLKNDQVTQRYLLPNTSPVQFVYAGPVSESAVWPPADANLAGRQALRSVSIMEPTPRGAEPIAYVRVWSEQARDCQFDVIAQECRETAP